MAKPPTLIRSEKGLRSYLSKLAVDLSETLEIKINLDLPLLKR